jgi:hypothetical protein
MPQRFGLAKAFERMPRRILDQFVDPLDDFGICSVPELVILPSLLGENEPRGSIETRRGLPLPDSSAWIAASRR